MPPLICLICVRELSKAIKFRRKCRESDNFFKKPTFRDLLNPVDAQESFKVKEEQEGDEQKEIKDEPSDDFALFENIDTILNENLQESNQLVDLLKKEQLFSDSSGSLSDYEEYRRQRKLKKRIDGFRDYEIGWDRKESHSEIF